MNLDKQKKILIVEDETSLRTVLVDVLQKQNFSVLEARNGKEGVILSLGEHPDLILLDIRMPVMGGMEALKEIRKNVWGAKVPVIILTNLSATNEDLVQDMVGVRPLYYLIKSDWNIYDVVRKIKEVLEI